MRSHPTIPIHVPRRRRRILAAKPHGGNRVHVARPVGELLPWMRATLMNRNIFEANKSMAAWAHVFAINGEPAQVLISRTRKCRPDSLRQARITLDFVACDVLRKYFDARPLQGMSFFLFFDGSPQWRGTEIFCSSLDWTVGSLYFRRLLPLLCLERQMLSAFKKTCAVLWQLWLLSGRQALFLEFLHRVRSATTDMGTEVGVINAPVAWLNRALRALGQPDAPHSFGAWTFPRGLQAPGWKHLWDLVLRHACCFLSFFPGFIEKVKALVSFLRDDGISRQLKRDLQQRGFPGIAGMLSKARLPRFIEWRWCKLEMVLQDLDDFWRSLKQAIDLRPFSEPSGQETDESCFKGAH